MEKKCDTKKEYLIFSTLVPKVSGFGRGSDIMKVTVYLIDELEGYLSGQRLPRKR